MPITSRRAGWVALALLLSLALTGCYQSLGGSLEPTQVGGEQQTDSTPLPQPTFAPLEGAPTEEQLTAEPSGLPTLTPFPTLGLPTDTPAPTDTIIVQPTDVFGNPLDGQGGAIIPSETAVMAVAVIVTATPLPPTETPSPTSTDTPWPTATRVPPTNTPVPTLPPPQLPTLGPTLTFTAVPFMPFAATATYTPYYVSFRPVEAVPLAESAAGTTGTGAAAPVVLPTQTAAVLPTQPLAVAQVPTATPAEALPLGEVAFQATLTGGQMTATQMVYEATATAAATLGVAPPALLPGVIYVTATPPIAGQQVIYVTATPALAGGICGEHFVLPGETLSRLALQYGVTVNQFAQANNIVNPDLIRAGDTLLVPCMVPATATPATTPFVPDGQGGRQGVYTVQPGDNIYRISLQFSVTMAELMAVNGISPTQMNFITVGQQLIIPASATLPAPTVVPGTAGGPVYIVITATPTPPGFVG
ncbi:MAG: LysM peptidoglycan-binding domain-containing protein [Anaerolineae bacterium]|nr:LysM peptidoglycan-binding domain-containing protein [Anaerolineae bacterium]